MRRTISVPGSIGDIAVHRDGRKLFAAGWDENLGGVLTVIDSAAGRVVDTTGSRRTGRTVSCMTVNANGTRLYIADFDGNLEARQIAGDAGLRATA